MRSFRTLAVLALAGLAAACQDAPLATNGGSSTPVRLPAHSPPSNDIRSGWIHGPGGEIMEVRFKVVDGWAIFQDDINLGRADKVAKTREELERRAGGTSQGVTIDGSTYRWPYGQVPYVIASTFGSSQQQTILNALAHIQNNNPGVKFKARTNETAYLVFAPHSSMCNSFVGRQNNVQTVNLTTGCAGVMGIVVHEALHALGMWHEQSRCDRDSYVTINLSNVPSGEQHNFDKKCTNATDYFAYDEGSIMHYDQYAFAINPSIPTITSKRGLGYLMGQRTAMSTEDVKTVHQLYAPPGPATTTVVNENGYPRITWSAVPGATHYTVYFEGTYEENDYERGHRPHHEPHGRGHGEPVHGRHLLRPHQHHVHVGGRDVPLRGPGPLPRRVRGMGRRLRARGPVLIRR
jgi:hypothetical protein